MKPLIAIIATFLLIPIIAACTPQAGNVETLTFMEDSAALEPQISLLLDKSRVDLRAGSDYLIEGVINYNQAGLEPIITEDGLGVRIEQAGRRHNLAPIRSAVVNDWELRLGVEPVRLDIESEGINGQIDLSGVAVRDLVIRERGGMYKLIFSEPNPVDIEKIVYLTTASQVDLLGLGNSRAEEMVFEGVSGIYTLDFSGRLQRDMNVNITYGLGTLTLIVPPETNVRITLSGNYRRINGEGNWIYDRNIYTSGSDGPLLNINVEMDMGGLTLALK
jgi:hypothetical protein